MPGLKAPFPFVQRKAHRSVSLAGVEGAPVIDEKKAEVDRG